MQKLLQDANIGRNLQRIRQSKGLSQADMVIRLELEGRIMSRAGYAHIEQGIRNVYVSDLILFRRILGVRYDDFFDGLDPNE